MSDPVVAITMLGLFLFMVLLGFPIAFTLMAMGIAFGYLMKDACGVLMSELSMPMPIS